MIKLGFCLFDSNYSPAFLRSWVSLCNYLNKNKVRYVTTQGDSCNAFFAKQMCLGGNVLQGPFQKPFQGRLEYEYLVFLGGNSSFKVEDFLQLFNIIDERDINFLSANVEGRHKLKGPFKNKIALAEYAEFDMTIIKSGVFEKLQYPWFQPHTPKTSKEQELVDIGICRRLNDECKIDLWVSEDIKIRRA